MGKRRSLLDEYQFPGFRPKAGIQGISGDPKARVIRLERLMGAKPSGNFSEPTSGSITLTS